MSKSMDTFVDKTEVLSLAELQKRIQLEKDLETHRNYIDSQSARFKLLNELATGLSQVTSDEDVFKLVALKTTGLIGTERASVALLNDAKNQLEVFALDGTKGALPTGTNLPVEGTLLGAVVKSKQVIIDLNPRDSQWKDCNKLYEFGMHSVMDAPLMVSGNIIGTLNVATTKKNAFDERDSEWLFQTATLLATTLEKNRLLNQTKKDLEHAESQAIRLDMLNELALQLSSVKNQQEAFQLVAKYLTKIVEGDRSTLAIINENGDYLTVMGLEGVVVPFKIGAQLPVEGTGLGHAIQTGQLCYIPDTSKSNFLEAKKAASETSLRSLMIAPLFVSGKIIGTLNVGVSKVDAYSLGLQQLMRQTAALLATTLESRQFLEQTQQSLKEEALLRKILGHSAKQSDLKSAFSFICQSLAEYFSVPRAGFVLFNESKTKGKTVAEYCAPGRVSSLGESFDLVENPIAQYVIQNKKTFFINNVQDGSFPPTVPDILQKLDIASLWMIPITVSDDVIGLIGLDTAETIEPTEREISLGETISVQVGQTLVRIQAAEGLQASEVQFRNTITHLPTPIAITDLTSGKLPYVNYAFTELFGGTIEEIANKKTAKEYYVDSSDRERIIEAFTRDGQISHTEVRFNKLDGTLIWADIAMQRINYFGTPAILTGFYDVTSRKQTEEMLRQAKESAEEANHLKSKFLSNMSHELRTPLNAIINMTGFVMDGLLGDVNEEQIDALEKTVDGGNHLLSLINDVLDLTKIEAGLMNIVFEPVDVGAILEGICATGKGLVKEGDIELIAEIAPDVSQIIGDKRRLRQIFLNLVSNGVKYTQEGKVVIKAKAEDEGIYVSVQDTGVGIDPEDFELIFQEFKQAKNTLGNVASTGLGLPITKQLVEMHGGKIWFESELGIGSTFSIFLPLVPTNTENVLFFDHRIV